MKTAPQRDVEWVFRTCPPPCPSQGDPITGAGAWAVRGRGASALGALSAKLSLGRVASSQPRPHWGWGTPFPTPALTDPHPEKVSWGREAGRRKAATQGASALLSAGLRPPENRAAGQAPGLSPRPREEKAGVPPLGLGVLAPLAPPPPVTASPTPSQLGPGPTTLFPVGGPPPPAPTPQPAVSALGIPPAQRRSADAGGLSAPVASSWSACGFPPAEGTGGPVQGGPRCGRPDALLAKGVIPLPSNGTTPKPS